MPAAFKPKFKTWIPAFAGMTFLLLISAQANAKGYKPDDVVLSTTPIGSPFLRHYAYDYNLDLNRLVRFEKRGFSRSEIITLALISEKTGKPMKDYGNRRLKEHVTLKQLAEEEGMDYAPLYEKAQTIKKAIEAKGDQNLPPPVFEKKPDPDPSPTPPPLDEKEETEK